MNTTQNSPETVRMVTPPVTIYETKKAVMVKAEMPGLEREAIGLELAGDELTVTGKTASFAVPEGYTVLYQERPPHAYARTFVLGAEVARNKIEAVYENGVLTVTLPRAEEAQPRRIEIQG